MLLRVALISGIGRFESWKSEASLRKLTLVYGHNAAGKSTLARVLGFAATGEVAELLQHRTIGAARLPDVLLEHSGGMCRFDGAAWSGVRPRVLVFDRDFVESHVYLGRRPSKEQRKELLRVALGAEDAAYAQEVDALSAEARQLTLELKPHAAAIAAAAAASSLSVAEFLALPPLHDPERARATAEAREREAIAATEIVKRPRPSPLPALPALDLLGIGSVLAEKVERIGREAEERVRAHLERRLHGRGEEWVRQGLAHLDGRTCPFCARDLDAHALVDHCRAWFGEAYDRLVRELDARLAALAELDRWWEEAKRVGHANLLAFAAWSELTDLRRPDLGSQSRKAELDAVRGGLGGLLQRRREHPLEPLMELEPLEDAAGRWRALEGAVSAYNEAIVRAGRRIEERCQALGRLSLEEGRNALRRVEAAIRRHGPEVAHAVAEQARLDARRAGLDVAKRAADARLKEQTQARLESFASEINRGLERLGATFRVERLGTERGGGAAGARFTVVLEESRLEVASREGEERFARVLSDGDRQTLALAVFLATLDDPQVLVFDDPATGLDGARRRALAREIVGLAGCCEQVIVLSHDEPFLSLVASANGAANELASLTLEAERLRGS